ncbi:hypothetical protein HDZ31DRAFT_81850 [Schizophyllum fasciatum]
MDGIHDLGQQPPPPPPPPPPPAPFDEGAAGPSQQAGPSTQPAASPVGPPANQLAAAAAPAPSLVPQKRRPGRPKGSGKKLLDPNAPKIKRPVGRPRKDGLPAGSLGPRPPRTRTQTAPLSVTPASLKKILHSIDPNLQQDDWPALAHAQPNAFLRALVTALNTTPGVGAPVSRAEEEAFRLHSYSLSAKAAQPEHIPSLYSVLKTFWLPCSPAYFSLIASASTGRTPSDHRFLYWDPLPLVFNGLLCPACCQAPLINRSRITSAPIKVYDLPKPFYIIGCEYVCRSAQCVAQAGAEGRAFASTDAAVLRALPAALIHEFPARLLQDDGLAGPGARIWNWQALGVSHTLWHLALAALRVGLHKDAVLHLVGAAAGGAGEPAGALPIALPPAGFAPAFADVKRGSPEAAVPPPMDASAPSQELGGSSSEVERQLVDADGDADADMEEVGAALEYPANYGAPFADASQSVSAAGSATQTTGAGGSQAYPSQPYASQPPPQPQPYAPFYSGYAVYGPHPGQGQGQGQGAAEDAFGAKRSPRHCLKCGSTECKGKGGRQHCMNACQDCGSVVCRGRNGRRRDKPCQQGWEE